MSARDVRPEPLLPLLERLGAAPEALLALGIPRCPACQMLPATLGVIARSRPGLAVGLHLLATPADWAAREEHLWPRGIRVSRSSVPSLTVLRHGRAVARREGSAPARAVGEWLDGVLGPAAHPIDEEITEEERATLRAIAPRRAQHHEARGGGGAAGCGVDRTGL